MMQDFDFEKKKLKSYNPIVHVVIITFIFIG